MSETYDSTRADEVLILCSTKETHARLRGEIQPEWERECELGCGRTIVGMTETGNLRPGLASTGDIAAEVVAAVPATAVYACGWCGAAHAIEHGQFAAAVSILQQTVLIEGEQE